MSYKLLEKKINMSSTAAFTKEEIVSILNSSNSTINNELFAMARLVRESVFGNKIFIYGFIYFSTFCRKNCSFCYYRNSNDIPRYRKSPAEVLEIAKMLVESGVNLIDLTMGEDPVYYQEDFKTLMGVIESIKNESNIPLMISPGVTSNDAIAQFAKLGVEWYALYQETHNRDLFSGLRIDQDYSERMERKMYAQKTGILIEEGLLAGVGETTEDIADMLIAMGKMRVSQTRAMSFVPQNGTPMQGINPPNQDLELKIIALMRIMYPHILIPASLDIEGIRGLKDRINAGANVVTSIIPPYSGLMGVAQSTKDVDEGGRTVEEVKQILKQMELCVADVEEYKQYLKILLKRQNELG